jgi:hypothetical protein
MSALINTCFQWLTVLQAYEKQSKGCNKDDCKYSKRCGVSRRRAGKYPGSHIDAKDFWKLLDMALEWDHPATGNQQGIRLAGM